MAPRWPKKAQRGAQEGPKTAPRAPKSAPTYPHEAMSRLPTAGPWPPTLPRAGPKRAPEETDNKPPTLHQQGPALAPKAPRSSRSDRPAKSLMICYLRVLSVMMSKWSIRRASQLYRIGPSNAPRNRYAHQRVPKARRLDIPLNGIAEKTLWHARRPSSKYFLRGSRMWSLTTGAREVCTYQEQGKRRRQRRRKRMHNGRGEGSGQHGYQNRP